MRFLAFPLAILASAAAHAEPETLTLSEADKQAILERKTDADLAQPTEKLRISDRLPHGEVGFMIGTGGARGVYGATSVPLGENGWASFAFENSRNIWPGR